MIFKNLRYTENMLRFLLVFLLFCMPARAQLLTGKGGELPLAVIKTPHFDVIHPPRLEGFARRVAAAAERMRNGVLEIVGNDPSRTFIVVNDETDDFNGFAVPGPYPFIRVFATFPRPTDIGAQWQDAMLALVSHEFAHVAHLSTRDDLRNGLRSIFGAVPGLLEARVPPAWFVEGYAVYLEGKLTTGGRVQDSGIRTLRAQIAREGKFPSLAEAGIESYDEYPFGNTRYVFGSGFVAFLIERFGEATIRQVIRVYNQRLAFSDAWFDITKQSLTSLWAIWEAAERTRAAQELEVLRSTKLEVGQRLHLGSGAPAWDGANKYAFTSGATIRFAQLENGKTQFDPQSIALPSRPHRLSWAKNKALVYSRNVVRGATTYGEVFRLENGIEQQLTVGARARDAIVAGDCIVYIRDVLDNSSIRQICQQQDSLLFAAPQGWHLFHLAPRANKIALTVWRPGGFLDVAVLSGQRLEFVTSDHAQDQFPTWLSDTQVVFSSDRHGTTQLFTTTLGQRSTVPLTAAAGGAYISSFRPNGQLTFSSYTGFGFETRIVQVKTGLSEPLPQTQPVALDGLSGLEYPIEPYNPLPLPVFWYPATTQGIGATVVGADPAGVLSWQLAAGYDITTGTGFGVNLNVNFAPSLEWSTNLSANADSSGWSVRLTAPWSGRGESQWTGQVGYSLRPTIGMINGIAFVALSINLGATSSDDWGYAQYGWAINAGISSELTAQPLTNYQFGIALTDTVAGLPLSINLGIRGKIGATPTLLTRAQTQTSFATAWRNEDGFIGLERLTLQPFANLQYTTTLEYAIGLRILADTIFNYYAPISFGLEFAYASGNGFAVRLVTVLPLEQLR